MSVILPIEIPKSCLDCPCHDGEYGVCNLTRKIIDDARPYDCPMQEVKHGQWIEKQVGNASLVDDGYKHINRVCLYCGAVQPVTEPRDNIICYYCGAMLDEEEKDNDGRNCN